MFCERCGTRVPDETPTCTLCGASLPGGRTADPAAVASLGGGPAGPISAAPPGVTGWAPTAPAPARAVAVAEVAYGGFWRRFFGVLLDSLILFFPAATIRVLLGLSPLDMFDAESPASYAATGFELALDWLYGACFICSSARGTLGMQIMDLHVTDLQGGRISFGRASWRYFAQGLTLLTFGFGYLLQLFTPRRQTLHDLVSGTVVVRPRPVHGVVMAPVMRLEP